MSFALTSSIAAGASVILSLRFWAVIFVVSTSRDVGFNNKLSSISLSLFTFNGSEYCSYPIYKTFNVYLQSGQLLTFSI